MFYHVITLMSTLHASKHTFIFPNTHLTSHSFFAMDTSTVTETSQTSQTLEPSQPFPPSPIQQPITGQKRSLSQMDGGEQVQSPKRLCQHHDDDVKEQQKNNEEKTTPNFKQIFSEGDAETEIRLHVNTNTTGFSLMHRFLYNPEFIHYSCHVFHDLAQIIEECSHVNMNVEKFKAKIFSIPPQERCGCYPLAAVWWNRPELLQVLPSEPNQIVNINMAAQLALFFVYSECFAILAPLTQFRVCTLPHELRFAFQVDHAALLLKTFEKNLTEEDMKEFEAGNVQTSLKRHGAGIQRVIHNLGEAFEFFGDIALNEYVQYHSSIHTLMDLSTVFFPGSQVPIWTAYWWIPIIVYCLSVPTDWVTIKHKSVWDQITIVQNLTQQKPYQVWSELVQSAKIRATDENLELLEQAHSYYPVLNALPHSPILDQFLSSRSPQLFEWKNVMRRYFFDHDL